MYQKTSLTISFPHPKSSLGVFNANKDSKNLRKKEKSLKKIGNLTAYIRFFTDRIVRHWVPAIDEVQNREGKGFPQDGVQKLKAARAWFRGQPVDEPLLPKVFRDSANETELALQFRRRARSVAPALERLPNRDELDEWLFLMQHYGTSTRLLDWTESPLIALFFALSEHGEYKKFDRLNRFKPVVWMVNPHVMNWTASGTSILLPSSRDEAAESGGISSSQEGFQNILGAFTRNKYGIDSPIAIDMTHINRRMHAQLSCFTVHGRDRRSLNEIFSDTDLVDKAYLLKIEIDGRRAPELISELRIAGVSYSTLFPDFEGLSKSLR
jgi:hypothetical protein